MGPLQYLGSIGKDLPILNEEEWELIFEFLECFILAEDLIEECNPIHFNWTKVKNTLLLLSKIKEP